MVGIFIFTPWNSAVAFLLLPFSPHPSAASSATGDRNGLWKRISLPSSLHRPNIKSVLLATKHNQRESAPEPMHHKAKGKGKNQTKPLSSISSSLDEDDSFEDDEIQLDFVLDEVDLKALSSKVSYFYLLHELGLSEDVMWKITHDAATVLGMTADNIRQKVQVLQFAMDLSIDDTKNMIERQPSILQLSAMHNLSPTLDWFLDSLSLSKKELRQLIVAQPCLLTCAESNLEFKLEFFTTNRGLGFSIDECRKLLLEEPRLWTCGVKSGLLPRVRFLLNEVGIPKDKLRAVVQKNPRILLYSLSDNLVPKLVNYLILTLQMEPKDIVKLLVTYPQVLDYNLDRHILPTTYYFLNDLDYSVHEFRAILLKFPRLLTHSLRKMKHVVGYLRYELGLDAAGVRRVLYQAPQIFGLNTEENVKPKVEYLQRFVTGETDSDTDKQDAEEQRQVTRRLILGMPTVLNLSVEANLRPKLEYLKNALVSEQRHGTTGEEGKSFRETLLSAPALLGYSLDKRIRPRMEKIIDAGIPASSITTGITMTEAKFEKWLQGRIQSKLKRSLVLRENFYSVTPVSVSNGDVTEEGSSTNTPTDGSARIVHWNRERKAQ